MCWRNLLLLRYLFPVYFISKLYFLCKKSLLAFQYPLINRNVILTWCIALQIHLYFLIILMRWNNFILFLKMIFNNTSNLHTPIFLNSQTFNFQYLSKIYKKRNKTFSELHMFLIPAFIERWNGPQIWIEM